jgi:hypothetical protein
MEPGADGLEKADKVHYYNDTSSWPARSRKLVRVRRMFDRSAVYLASVKLPQGSAEAQRARLSSINLTSAEVDNYATDFRSKTGRHGTPTPTSCSMTKRWVYDHAGSHQRAAS